MVLTNALGMEGLIRTVGIAQWSAPTAVTTLVLACQYDCQPRYVAGVILATTLLSVVTVPVLLMWLM
jgi:predicted permease